jgi:tripartite-type tricarboxylate transporter receptor subunit TctC
MGIPRRRFLQYAGAAAAAPAFARRASALDYPNRPVRIIVGFAAGGPQDIFARLIGQRLSERLGHQFVIENRLGAGGNVAAEYVVNAAPDGYTLLNVGPPNAINATLYQKLNFNFIHDIAPVAGVARSPNVLDLNLSVPARTVPEFIAYAKAHPGKINAASGGNGTVPHVAAVLFNILADVELVHVPYRGEALAIPDLMAGQIQVEFGSIAWSIEYIRAGKIRGLAVTTATRSPLLPDLPAVAEFVPGYEASGWYGIGAPSNTPAEIVEKLNGAINAVLADPAMQARLADIGGTALVLSPAAFGQLIDDETGKWAKVIKTAGITAE